MGKPRDIETVKTGLQIEEELDTHRTGWTVQRVGFVFIFLLVFAAAAGLFGNGPLSKTNTSAEQVTVESERFFRYQSPMPLKISAPASGNKITVSFPNPYLERFEVKAIQPEPLESKFANGQVEYSFEASGKADIVLYLIPQERGNINGTIQVNDQSILLKHFIYP